MDSGLTYEHKEGILSIPTESKLGKKKNVQYYFKLDKGTLSWYSKASDKKPKGSLALFTATEIKRQGGLTVAINFHEGGAGMSTLALNCQSEADSEDWVMRLTQSMVVSHADPEQQQQQQAQKAHPRYSIFVRNKGTSVAEPTPIIVNESSSPVHPQHQARPVTMAPRGSASTDGTGKSVMPGFVGASTRAGNRLTNIFSMSVHRKPRVEANDSEWVNVSNSDGGSESPAGKEEADDFVVVGGNSPTPAVTAAAAKVDETNEKRSSYDELTSGKSNVAETGQPTLCLDDDDDDDDDIVIVSNNNSSNGNLAPAVPPVNISKHARRSANFTSTLFVPSSLKKYEDVDDGKAEDKKSDSNDNAVSANSTVMSAVKNTEEKVTEKPKQESSEKAKDEDRATNPFVDTEEEKAPEEAQRKEEEDKKDNEEEEKKKAEEPEDKSVAADAKPQTAEKKEGKEEKDTTVAEVNVPEEKEIEAVTASSAATETKPVQKLVEKEPEPKEETDKKDEPESKEEEEEEKDDNDDSYEEEEKEKEESDEDDDDEPENDTKASEEEEKHTNKEPEQKVKEEKEEEVQPSEETLNCLSDEFAKDCDCNDYSLNHSHAHTH